MSAVIGIFLFALAALVFGTALIVSRKPNAPVWLTEGFAGALITITTIACAVMGLGLVGQFAVSYGREPLGAIEIILISISLVVLIVVFTGIVKALRRSATRPAMTAVAEVSAIGEASSAPLTASAVTALGIEGESPPVPVTRDPSHSGRRKRLTSKRAA